MRLFALVMLFLNPVLWASFYAISKGALHSVDPIHFATLELSVAAIPAIVLLGFLARVVNLAVVKAGAILGAVLFLAVIGSTIALYFTTATNTAFFPALNGAIAAAITVFVLRKPIDRSALIATALATVGAVLVIAASSQGGGSPRGDVIAILAAAAYTMYIFAVDNQVGENSSFGPSQLLAVSCIEILFMACLAWVVFLCRGGEIADLSVSREVAIAAIYVGLFTTVAPTVIACLFQRHARPMTVALLYILEPIWGAIAASLLEGEVISPAGYIGGGLIVVASLINVVCARPSNQLDGPETRKRLSPAV